MLRAQERAMQLSPNESWVVGLHGWALALLGPSELESRAWQLAQRSVDLDPRYTMAHAVQGHVASALGKYDEAAAAYQRALELEPESWGGLTRIRLGLIEAERGHGEVAREALRTVEQLATGTSRPWGLARLIWAYGAVGSPADAARLFTELQRRAQQGS
jgi:tetratricopeptide (TPR) repeat protein